MEKPSYAYSTIFAVVMTAMIIWQPFGELIDIYKGIFAAWTVYNFAFDYTLRRYWNVSVSEYRRKRNELAAAKAEAKRKFKESVGG